MQTTAEFLTKVKSGSLKFSEIISHIDAIYEHQPTGFKNGNVYNEASQNQGSAKVFSFAKINQLSAVDTLPLFAEHYQSVLDNPDATDHQNIRQFILNGWEGISFDGEALAAK